MERRVFLLVIALVTALVALGVFLLLYQGGEGDKALSSDLGTGSLRPSNTGEGDAGAHALLPAAAEKEVLPAETAEAGESAAMPESFRKSLGALKGRVLEEDESPIPGIKVEALGVNFLDALFDVEQYLGEEPIRFELETSGTLTAADGTFLLEGVFPRTFYGLWIDPDGPRNFSRILDHLPSPGETVDLGDIKLPPHGVLVGRVVDPGGAPIQQARVRATQLPPLVFLTGLQNFRKGCTFLFKDYSRETVIDPPPVLDRLFRRLPIPLTFTGMEGAFRLEGVPLGLVNLVADRQGYVTARQGPVSFARTGEQSVGDVVLDQGLILKGRVEDFDGHPVSGAEVRIGTIHGVKELVVLQPPVFTNEEGLFTASGFEPLPIKAAARRQPGDPWTVGGPFSPGGADLTLALPPAFDLRVTVKGEDGSPAKGSSIKIRHREGARDFLLLQQPTSLKNRVKRVEEGVFEVSGLARGRYDLFATAPGCAVKWEKVEIKDQVLKKEVVLEPACTARVRVLFEKDRSPVEWATVYASTHKDDWIKNPNRFHRSRTDGSGLAVLKKMSPGAYEVSVSHPGFALTMDTLKVPDGEEKVILVGRGGAIEGVVLGTRPSLQGPYMVVLSIRQWQGGPEGETPRITATDLNGKFRIGNLTPGSWYIYVEQRVFDKDLSSLFDAAQFNSLGRARVDVKSGETTYVEIPLGQEVTGPGAEVSGRVTVDGVPASGVQVSCRIGRRSQTTTDASGQYDLGRIPVGENMLMLSHLPGAMSMPDYTVSRKIKIQENIPLYEDFYLLTGTITGRLVHEAGEKSVKGLHKVIAHMEEGEAPYSSWVGTMTDMDGRFTFQGVPIGIYTVMSGEQDVKCRPVTGVKVYRGSRTTPVILMKSVPFWVRGRVKLPEPLKNAPFIALWARPKDNALGGGATIQVSPETGAFETQDLLAGRYQGILYGSFQAQFKPLLFTVPEGGTDRLDLEPEEK